MATIRGESSDQTVKAFYSSYTDKVYIEQQGGETLRIKSCDLQATIEALENLKRLMTVTLGSDALK
ncbi:MAG: hypothetical protein ABFC28_01460 [Rikenellaceae bacterium]